MYILTITFPRSFLHPIAKTSTNSSLPSATDKYRPSFLYLLAWYSLDLLLVLNGHSSYHFLLFPSPKAHDFHHLKFILCYRHFTQTIFLHFFSLVVILFGFVVHTERSFPLWLDALPLTRGLWFPPPQVYPVLQTFNSNFFVAFFSSVVWYSLALLSTLNVHSGYHFPLLPSCEAHDFHHLKFTQCYRHSTQTIFLCVF